MDNWLCDLCELETKGEIGIHVSSFVFSSRSVLTANPTDAALCHVSCHRERRLLRKTAHRYGSSQSHRNEEVRHSASRSLLSHIHWLRDSYIHLVCAIWHPEPKFESLETLRAVEGIPTAMARRNHHVSSASTFATHGLLTA